MTLLAPAPLRKAAILFAVAALSGCGFAEWPPTSSRRPVTQPPPAAASPVLMGQPQARPSDPVQTAALPPPRSPTTAAVPPSPPVQPGTAPTAVVVESGDTIYSLSRRYGVPTRAIIEANGLEPPFRLTVGQRIVLPRQQEHVVAGGETLFDIAGTYGVDPYVLASANGLIAPYRLRDGQRLTVPAPDPASRPPVQQTAALGSSLGPPPAPAPAEATGDEPALAAIPRIVPSEPVAKPPPVSGRGFVWPVKGKIISDFGPKAKGRRNDGVNIAGPRGTPVRAAEGGVVAYAGNELRGFGNLVLLRHADGWVTAYAHNDELLVQRGDTVQRGQTIAKLGSTGSVTEPQLHFQLRKGKQPVDPVKYLASS